MSVLSEVVASETVPTAQSLAPEDELYVFAASHSQQRLWFLEQFEPQSAWYNIPSAVRLRGALDDSALERAVTGIVERHESLRTTFAMHGDEPVQVVHSRLPVTLRRIDLTRVAPVRRDGEVERIALDESRLPFDLATGPLLRVTLLRLGFDDHVLLVTMHHIVSDGWSMGIFVREMQHLYGAARRHLPPVLPPLAIQYADYAEWQREWLKGDVLDRQLEYWKGRLGRTPPVLSLPTDRPRPPIYTSRGGKVRRVVPAETAAAFAGVARRAGCTSFMALLAVFAVLLHRYSRQQDICIGTAVANRTRAETRGLIGLFVNTLVLRLDLSADPPFRVLLERARQICLDAYAHQDLPFERLVEELNPPRDMSHPPLFQAMFILQNLPVDAAGADTGGLEISLLRIDKRTSNFDMTLMASEGAKGIELVLEYNADLFDAGTAERMLAAFERLLEGAAAEPEAGISMLPLLDDGERRRILRQLNPPAVALPDNRLVHDRVAAHAERTPDRVAVVHDGAHLTYGALDARAAALAARLRDEGVGPETRVGVSTGRSPDMIAAVLGVMKAGGAFVPLDPNYPRPRIAHMLEDSGAPVVLAAPGCLDADDAAGARLLVIDEEATRPGRQAPRVSVDPGNLAYAIYTSGSTGRSKGVMVEHASLSNAYRAWERAYALEPQDRHLQMASFSFDVFAGDFVRALCSGGTLVLCPYELLLSPEELAGLVARERITCAEFVPAVLRALIEHAASSGAAFDSLRLVACGSDHWSVADYRELARLCGPGTRIVNSYGLTEATIDSTWFDGSAAGAAERGVPIGTPFPNMQVYVLDSRFEPLPIGVPGELHVGGDGVARGYHGAPDLTAAKFVPDPFAAAPGRRLYRTGDLGRHLPDGNIEFLGRADRQVKLRGQRIELGDVETCLRDHPQVGAAVVDVVDADRDDPRLVAWCTPAADAGARPTPNELRGFAVERLPGYMVPSEYVFVDALPLTPNGKVDRAALPAPGPGSGETATDRAAPRTPVEEILVDIWQRVLRRPSVGVHDNLFAIGGHSLLATQINSRLRSVFGIDFPLRHVFEYPTVASLAARVEAELSSGSAPEASPIRPAAGREHPLSFAQQRLWILDQLNPGNASYNVAECYRVEGPLDARLLERCVAEVVRRHDVLRTTFHGMRGEPVQIVAGPETVGASIDIPVVDVCALCPAAQAAEAPFAQGAVQREIERIARDEARAAFDLAAGPLFRIVLLRVERSRHVVLLTMHHIVTDEWSSAVLLGEIAALYEAFAAGAASPLPPLPVQYADYARWQRAELEGARLDAQLDYWKSKLADASRSLDIATDRPRPSRQTFRGDSVHFRIDAPLAARIREVGSSYNATTFMTLLAAFQALLHRYSGQRDVLVGVPVSNRTRMEIENLIGLFVNTLVHRADFGADPTFGQLIEQVRRTALEAYAHQDCPFERLVDELQPERDLGRSPLFQAMFVMQNMPSAVPRLERIGLNVRAAAVPARIAKFDLTLFVTDGPDGFAAALNYNADLFERATIERMAAHFEALLTALADDPARRVSAADLLAGAERDEVLHRWSGTRVQRPIGPPLHRRIERQAGQRPDAIACVADGEHATGHVTYRELNARANGLARRLRDLGVDRQSRVGVLVERSPELLIALLGVLKAGAAYVPLDRAYPDERLALMLREAGAVAVITQSSLRSRIGGAAAVVAIDAEGDAMARDSAADVGVDTDPDALAYLMFTSGSTGKPKGTMVTQRGLANYLDWCEQAYPLDAGRGSLVHSTVAFDATITALFPPLCAGGTVTMLPETADVEALQAAMGAHPDYAVIKITPAHLDMLRHYVPQDEAAGCTRAFVIGGENLTAGSIAFWQTHAPGTQLFNEYGPTETVVGCVVFEAARWRGAGSVPIGTPIPNTYIYVLDRQLEPVPPGVPGELYIGGAGVARGYSGRPDLTADRFVPDPFGGTGPGARLYRTGDRVRWLDDGRLVYLGRFDDQVKLRGFRIELGEIEAALAEHPDVAASAVVVREDRPGDRRLAAYVVMAPDTAGDVRGIRSSLARQLPAHMMPNFIVTLDALPLTVNGKVDRRALPAPGGRADLSAAYEAPRTRTEELLAELWAEVLGAERVGAHDDFFELGGHSLLAAKLIARVPERLGVALPLRQVFETPRLAQMAEAVEAVHWALAADPGQTASREEGEL